MAANAIRAAAGPLPRIATEAEPSAADGENVELFPDFAEPLRGDLCYLEAALSFYHGSSADADVKEAWARVLTNLRDVRADYLRLLHEKVERIEAGLYPIQVAEAEAGR